MTSERGLENTVHVVRKMAELVGDAMSKTRKLFLSRSSEGRELIWEELNNLSIVLEGMREEVFYSTLMYVARVQPLGKDLLLAYMLINVAYDMYRISRYIREIARIDNLLYPSLSLADLRLEALYEKAFEAILCLVKDLAELRPFNKGCVEDVDAFVDNAYADALKSFLRDQLVYG